MPSRTEIFEQITNQKATAQDIIRRKYLKELANYTKRDTIILSSAFSSPKFPNIPGFLISITTEDIQGFMSAIHGLTGNKLDIILHSPGGSVEAAEQIVHYIRQKYNNVRAIIMGKHSAI